MTNENPCVRNHYEILGVDPDAPDADIKENYRKLLLKTHPDKQLQKNETYSSDLFHEIEKAWSVLSDPVQRKQYDAKIKESQLVQSAPIQLVLKRSEMVFCPDSATFTMDCRCGGEFRITKEQIDEGYDLIPCSTCTLLGEMS